MAWARQCVERAQQFQLENRPALAESQLEQCACFLEQALAADPEDISARCFLIGCLMRLDNFPSAKEQALYTLRKISEEHALLQDPLLHLAIAQSANRLGQHEDAIAFAQRAVTEYPLHPQPCATLGRALLRTGRAFAGNKMVEAALDRDCDPRCAARLSEANRRAVVACLDSCMEEVGQEDSSDKGGDCSTAFFDKTECLEGGGRCQERAHGNTAAICGEGAAATRYGRTGVADERGGANSSESTPISDGTRPSRLQLREVAPSGATASPVGLCARSLRLAPEDRYLGVHQLLIDSHVVYSRASSSSDVLGTLSAGSRVRVSGAVVDPEDSIVWGRIHSPLSGWMALVNLKTSLWWTKQVAPPSQPIPASPRPRSMPFGKAQLSGPHDSGNIRAAAISDLERIFSGLMPANVSPHAVVRKETSGTNEPMATPQNRCSSCNRCYTCCEG